VRLIASRQTRPVASTTSSVAAGGTDTVTGAKTKPRKAKISTAALVPNTRQNSGIEFSRVRMAQASHARWTAALALRSQLRFLLKRRYRTTNASHDARRSTFVAVEPSSARST
jgi:hypothetical protein